ncbi:hypothetical protein Psta_3013 [Pirellula staleyi DSM 6068]|uniref:Lipoprotein n=1 Tax=Pirellula staleyi (strain ATCC 27377 / DSM 6068 / ICPB 4128) TaxID=530564 RepID=D2R9C8_PIRSD|nr:hypothetical protein [Pirellula staleyi]ADB17678.1 hypothetical protein Psta_3013 [Pirellula staleyi DSM 6068]
MLRSRRQFTFEATRRLAGCSLAALLLVPGCGSDGRTRYRLSGKITFAGQPIPKGIIYFDPDVAQGNDGPQGFAIIENGSFDTKNLGQGTSGGAHLARVFGCDGIEGPEAPMGRPIFPEYTLAVTLPAEESTLDLEVPRAALTPAPGRVNP